ncbi:hypothetical protein C8J42_10941 [Sphingomonas sp. PP-CE-1A-559]|nr:hypothetical protein C8J42_10941 [Sphingomonas sp. PP-CE-1A-559]
MSVVLILALAAMQSDSSTLTCGGSGLVRNCTAADGSTYIERRIGQRLVRKGTTSDGQSWTEYVSQNLDGWRLQGEDSTGAQWFQMCNPRSGIRGTDRSGQPFARKVGEEGCTY